MKRLQAVRFGLAAMVGAVMLVMAAAASRAAEEREVIIEKQPVTATTFHYVYYPESEFYFVPEKHVYWFREGSSWHSTAEIPPGIILGAGVTLDVDRPDPWTTHEVIVKKYGGKHHKIKIKEKIDKDND